MRETCDPPQADYDAILATLRQFTTNTVGAPDNRNFTVLICHPASGKVLGGLSAQSQFGGFHIDMIAVPEGLRKRGLGTRLMQAAEAEAKRRQCHVVWLDTYSFQSRQFYERLGFTVFGKLEGPAPIYPRFFMQKNI